MLLDSSPPALPNDFQSVHDLLDYAALRWPSARALRDTGGAWTYTDLARSSRGAARALSARGVRHGDRVAVPALPLRQTVALLYGCSRVGAVFLPVAPDASGHQRAAILQDAEPTVVVADAEELSALCAATPDAPDAPDTEEPTDPAGGEDGPAAADGDRPAAGDDPALFIYTSGSTARPKAVICPHRQIVFAVRAIAERLDQRPGDVVYCRLPLSFDYGLYQVFLSALTGSELVLADPTLRVTLLADLHASGATVMPLVPSLATMLVQLAARTDRPPAVRTFTNTGEHLPASLAARLRAAFPGSGVHLMFGITECKRVSVLERDGDLVRPGSVGRPLTGTTVWIAGPDGRPEPPGETGEIVVVGPHVMAGYWRSPEQQAQRFRTDPRTGERQLWTGDFGSLDADGYLYFHGRRDQIFKLRDTRTSAQEIEAAALLVEGVTAAAVLPPAQGRGAVLCLVTSRRPEEVTGELVALIGPTKVPAVSRVLPELPLTGNGKTDRARLAQQLAETTR
ncbi:AMP-binding protein [Streptomyces sp. DSM 44915]|uniref:AMP-binding protein n=1 Tax=Streptomyces chisholmiae TaxID=3075540 RepID=A0ABU2JM80_9ACTN|nr:AMP-binding protein [Streptomyces sp. DSM 44915]MDT0266096.1 AMP-binding protein [Streptomyces sp. DSM 44915]